MLSRIYFVSILIASISCARVEIRQANSATASATSAGATATSASVAGGTIAGSATSQVTSAPSNVAGTLKVFGGCNTGIVPDYTIVYSGDSPNNAAITLASTGGVTTTFLGSVYTIATTDLRNYGSCAAPSPTSAAKSAAAGSRSPGLPSLVALVTVVGGTLLGGFITL